jgi:hypothetical protein
MVNHKLAGIVDSVSAVRKSGSDEVLYLKARLHFEFDKDEYQGIYGGLVTQDWELPLPIDSGINPGDMVAVQIQVVSPFGQRFAPALEMGDPRDEGFDEDAPLYT